MNTQSSPNQHESSPTKDHLVASKKKDRDDNEYFLFRNKSESLLKDLEESDPEQSGIEEIVRIDDKKDTVIKSVKKIAIP
jgi:hypothetical protein